MICVAVAAGAEEPERAPVPPDFAQLVENTRRLWNVPGVSVAIVQDGRVSYAEGFGLRESGRPEAMTGDTIYGIASITKLLVTGAIAVLVNEGRVDLDRPVIHYLPEFEVADPYVTAHVTLRDLLAHRSGIDFDGASGGLGEQVAEWDSSELVRRAKWIGQQFELRAEQRYNDFGFFVLAEVVSRVSGQPWNEFIRGRVAGPLGMQHTWATAWDFLPRSHVLPTGNGWSETIPRGLAGLPKDIDIAVPHIMWPKTRPQLSYDPRELERTTVHFHRSPTDPCQGAWSSARDLAIYAGMWLNDGRAAEDRFLKPEVAGRFLEWNESLDPRWPVRRDPGLDERRSAAWEHDVGQALGFLIYDYAGHMLVGHDGYELGYSSLLRMDRERGLAVVVLVNNSLYDDGSFAMSALAGAILDWHYGLPVIDRNAVYHARFLEESTQAIRKYREAADERDAQRDTTVKPTLALERYAGVYEHPYVGRLEVLLRGGRLVARTSETAEWLLEPWRGDVFEGDYRGAMVSRSFFEFRVGLDGKVKALELLDEKLRYERTPAD